MSTIKIGSRTFSTGDTVTFNSKAKSTCHGPEGLKVVIHRIRGGGSSVVIGLYSPDQRIEAWADLDGDVPHHKGWWISADVLLQSIVCHNTNYERARPFKYHGTDLKGKPCRMLASLDNGTVFVEFEEDVNGCSADGLGKSGRCVAVDNNVLAIRKREKHAK